MESKCEVAVVGVLLLIDFVLKHLIDCSTYA